MAKMSPKGKITGVSGPVYFRELNNVQIVQTRPDRSRQKKGNNVSARMFEKTAYSLKVIRQSIESFLGKRYEANAHQRLMGQVMTALRKNTTLPIAETTVYNTSVSDVVGFEWNTAKLFSDTFLGNITTKALPTKELEVTVSSFVPLEQIDFPPTCTHASLRIERFFMGEGDAMFDWSKNTFSIDFKKSDSVTEDQSFNPHYSSL